MASLKFSFTLISILIPFLLLLLSTASAAVGATSKISYSDHCAAIVPESPTIGHSFPNPKFYITGGYFTGGDPIFNSSSSSKFLSFIDFESYETNSPSIIKLSGFLNLRVPFSSHASRHLTELVSVHRSRSRHRLRKFRPRLPRTLHFSGRISFNLYGFWNERSGNMCMIATSTVRSPVDGNLLDLSAVFKMKYLNVTNISTSISTGTLETIADKSSPNYFEPISVLLYGQQEYEYLPKSDVEKFCSKKPDVEVEEKKLPFDLNDGNFSCFKIMRLLKGRFRLEYDRSNCADGKCGPFSGMSKFLPSHMSFNQIMCSGDSTVRMFIGFSNSSRYVYRTPIVPDKSLVAEGNWNKEKNQLCLVACHINITDSLVNASVGNFSIGLTLWFPASLSLKRRSVVVGQLWSNKEIKDPRYFGMASLRSLDADVNIIPGLKYNYNATDAVIGSCPVKKKSSKAGKSYPDGRSAGDMRFDIMVRDKNRKSAWGFATPISIGEKIYGIVPYVNFSDTISTPIVQQTNSSLLNVSYRLNFEFLNTSYDAREDIEISAEGIYDATSGILCMVGCWYRSLSNLAKQTKNIDPMDCEIQINIQLSALNPDAEDHLKGTVSSTREKSHPLYFEQLEVTSFTIYRSQAVESIQMMDIEIIMVLVSLTLVCIFVGFQLFYVSKNLDVLPSISITMLVILTLGHMIPLVLNFEALFFMNRNRQDVMLSGGWLEVNEVVVRVMTMVAFLLQFRFLQMAWSARYANEHKQALCIAEKKALRFCLPLYFIGGVITWFVHARLHENQVQTSGFVTGHSPSIWEGLISCAGLLLDGFLLPQIILNTFTNSKNKALVPVFYIGTTLVRAMPHLYDAYRARHYVPRFNSSYIYASPDRDLYSTAWDIIIPLEGLVFAAIIFLQQSFGGSCILPPRFRKASGYELASSTILDSHSQAASTGIELN